jgi:hypothetical protein
MNTHFQGHSLLKLKLEVQNYKNNLHIDLMPSCKENLHSLYQNFRYQESNKNISYKTKI